MGPPGATRRGVEELSNQEIRLERGDITQADVDAIVNAANANLVLGGGVCNAIHEAGGPTIGSECLRILVKRGALKAGEAVATTGGSLRARYVIHAVGPNWGWGSSEEAEKLGTAYRAAIKVADDLRLRSIALPSLSTGALGYPVDQVAPIAVQAVRAAIREAKHVRDVRFILRSDTTYSAYRRALGETGS